MPWYFTVLLVIACCCLWLVLSAAFYRQFFKRFYDVVLSGLAIIVLSPVILVLTVIGAFEMKGNPYFLQERPGKNEKIFKLVKFRSMTNAKDKNGNFLPDEERYVKYGLFLRKLSLDELPELFNIFKGDMSIIGPRPLLVRYLPYYTEEERHRHDVRPGLSGLAQVEGRNFITWEETFQYDLKYVRELSLKMDVSIVLKTIRKVLSKEGISEADGTVDSKGREVHIALDLERAGKNEN